MAEQIGYVADTVAKSRIETLAATRALPEQIDQAFINGLNQYSIGSTSGRSPHQS